MQQQPFCVYSKRSFNTISKVFRSVCCSSNTTKSGQTKISSPYLLPNKTAIPKLHKEEITVTPVLPSFSLASKLYWKTPNKNLSHFYTSIIMSVLNIRIYLGCYIQVLYIKNKATGSVVLFPLCQQSWVT